MAGLTTGSIRCRSRLTEPSRSPCRPAKSASSSLIAEAATTSPQPGDYGILTEGTGGTFILEESDGQIEAFNANGTLNYIADTDGNRVTAIYTGGKLTGLEASNGAPTANNVVGSLTIAYNAAGLIASVTASDGSAITYAYNSARTIDVGDEL